MLARGVELASRRVLRVAGAEALPLLQRVLTNDVRALAKPGALPVYAALQNAQGRVEHDVFLHRAMSDGRGRTKNADGGAGGEAGSHTHQGGGPPVLLADLPADGFDAALDLLKKLRLRAQVSLDDVSDDFKVVAAVFPSEAEADDDATGLSSFSFLPLDPRWVGLGLRGIVPAQLIRADGAGGCGSGKLQTRGGDSGDGLPLIDGPETIRGGDGGGDGSVSQGGDTKDIGGGGDGDRAYREWRYRHGIAEGTAELGGLLPLECNLAGLHAISFDKGCYIGQELTARTHFTGVVRKRLLPAHFTAVDSPARPGMDIFLASADPSTRRKSVGKVVAAQGGVGLVLLR